MTALDGLQLDPSRDDELVLVDALDRPLGTASKAQAHLEGLLHRAFSVVLFRKGAQGPEMLISQRAHGKYHSGGLWANSCCSHPRAGESLADAVPRRLQEELGCSACDLREVGAFVYRAEFANGLAEYEYDHVSVGRLAGEPKPDPAEVEAVRWVGIDALAVELAEHPEEFCAWAFTVFSFTLPLAESVLSEAERRESSNCV